jgi:hypothetical protein
MRTQVKDIEQRRMPLESPNGSLDYCGFECPSCGFQHHLSDRSEGIPIVELFRSNSVVHPLACPECGVTSHFSGKDLKLFASFYE